MQESLRSNVICFCRYRLSILLLTFLTYTAYHMSRKPISVVKNVLNRNCSGLPLPPDTPMPPPENWCDWAPFGNFYILPWDLLCFSKNQKHAWNMWLKFEWLAPWKSYPANFIPLGWTTGFYRIGYVPSVYLWRNFVLFFCRWKKFSNSPGHSGFRFSFRVCRGHVSQVNKCHVSRDRVAVNDLCYSFFLVASLRKESI